ncbi:sensor histidine kinase [Undibacterium sp. Di27W]|uniref:sensor histidine kinase n=1 Tax=Undibacterium sp. Di27W TaxID=3413036 RepID=UPI003BF06259
MFTTLWFIIRASFGWGLVILFTTIFLVNGIFRGHIPDVFVLAPLSMVALVMGISFSHVRRVRLIASKVNATTLANRQRRQIEIPLEANEAFELVDAAIRELPGAEDTESARDSLQIRAKIKRIDPYQANFIDELKLLDFLTTKRNQILATITPGDGVGSLTLICEPERPAWTDLFLVDNGTNLENAEAISRAITRRIAERRRSEKASTAQSVTEKELTVAKLNLLHAQVEPHFLYNTLASAQLLTRADPAAADQMLGNLITYLRHSLPRTEDTASSIGEELERSIAYLDIMKIRMGARLNIQIQVPAELKALPFPMMMLQTLVENAIKHGLEPKTGGGTIWIIARQHENNVAVTVADDGNGLGTGIGGTGIGLKNVRERLRLAHGNAASFVLVGNFPSGVAATITVPVIKARGEQHA